MHGRRRKVCKRESKNTQEGRKIKINWCMLSRETRGLIRQQEPEKRKHLSDEMGNCGTGEKCLRALEQWGLDEKANFKELQGKV